MNLQQVAYLIFFGIFVLTTILPYVIFPFVKRRVVYWPATSFLLIASGLPGWFLLVNWFAGRTGHRPSELNLYVAGCAVFAVMAFLQFSALQIVLRQNRRLRLHQTMERN